LSSLTSKDLSIEALIQDLPQSNLKKSIKKNLQGREQKKSKKRRQGEEEKASLKLPVPLTGPDGERAARSALYERAKKDVKVWDSVVHSQRSAEHKSFPLIKPDLRVSTSADHVASFKPKNPLEEQVMALLKKSNKSEESKHALTQEEESELAQMSVREAEERRREIVRLKILQTYQEAKLKRRNKIKSKQYRKMARKERDREKAKELEELRLSDPQAFNERMKEAEKERTRERATLRHRNNSKYLQMLAKKGKNDKDVRLTYV